MFDQPHLIHPTQQASAVNHASLQERIILGCIQLHLIRFGALPTMQELTSKAEIKRLHLPEGRIQCWLDRMHYLYAIN